MDTTTRTNADLIQALYNRSDFLIELAQDLDDGMPAMADTLRNTANLLAEAGVRIKFGEGGA